ncbi:MAG: STAS domain-containing protein [Candidatus Brocadiia bacterium]
MISQIRPQNDVTVVELEGRLDASTAPDIKAELHELIEQGRARLVVNLEALEFIDSAGLGVLVSSLRRAAGEGGDLRVAEVPPFCRSIFELTRLTRVFSVTESESEAIAAIEEGAND